VIEKRSTQVAVLGVAVLVLAAILCWRLFSREPTPRTPEELVQIALSGASEDEREEAALELARHSDQPLVELRRVFDETDSRRVQAVAMHGLGRVRDWESIPKLIELMESDSEFLRGRAASAVNQIAREDFGFRANDPEKKRIQAIKRIEEKWPLLYEGFQAKSNAEKIKAEFERRLKEQGSKS